MAHAGFTASDHHWMARALRLAERGSLTARPNPRVGCVLVRDGALVGEGWHARTGDAHAEVNALAAAGDAARGASAFVNLEPCSHHGRTPPCVDALIAAGVAEVVVAMRDPNPAVAGRGLERLRANGVTVREGLLASEAEALNVGFSRRMLQGRPWVRCKLAASLDGRTAMASGESRWITGAAARADVHRWRARSCAIITGSGTVLSDDPALTVRDIPQAGAVPPPLRVVLDRGLATSPEARLFRQAGDTWLFTDRAESPNRTALERAGARIEAVRSDDTGLDLDAVLVRLAQYGINEVLVEAGATLAGAFVAAGLVDELIIYQAPHLMGDAGHPLVRLPGLDTMARRQPLEWLDMRRVGEDLRLMARPVPSA